MVPPTSWWSISEVSKSLFKSSLCGFQIWKEQHKTIKDSGYVLKEAETFCRSKVKTAINNLNEFNTLTFSVREKQTERQNIQSRIRNTWEALGKLCPGWSLVTRDEGSYQAPGLVRLFVFKEKKLFAGKWLVLNLFVGWPDTEPSTPVKLKNSVLYHTKALYSSCSPSY